MRGDALGVATTIERRGPSRWPALAEPAVALTDYGLALEAAAFCALLARGEGRRRPLQTWFALFFGSVSLAAFAGGTTHGFFPAAGSPGQRLLWSATLLATGLTGLTAWGIGARLQFPPPVARRVTAVAGLTFAVYCAAVLRGARHFRVAVLAYLPAVLFLLLVFGVRYRDGRREVLRGLAGLALTLVAAGVQQGKVALHPRHFDHNALYHLIQGVALLLFFGSGRRLVEQERRGGR